MTLLASSSGVFPGTAAAAPPAACPLEIQGFWQATGSTSLSVLSFSSDGWANVLGGSAPARAADLDILAQVSYEIEDPRAPERIVFNTRRGNDLFPPGESAWEIEAATDDTFVARAGDVERSWARLRTHRRFLTFAHRADSSGDRQTATFAVWTGLDGRRTAVEAFGVYFAPDDSAARFGEIPPTIAVSTGAKGRESDIVLRVELGAAEYFRSHRMLEAWSTLARSGALADEDPHRYARDFLATVVESINRCRTTIRVPEDAASPPGDAHPHQQLPVIVRALRSANNALHVADAAFPGDWSPPELTL